MEHTTQRSGSFPSVSLPHYAGGLPVEVTLIGQLGPGEGDRMIASVAQRQKQHPQHVDALDEPSARIGATDLEHGDATALYSFVVGPQGHPFHCHAGHRVFTAVTGSGGACLRFSTASRQQIAEDPVHFVRALQSVHVPPDALVTVRFGGGVWHQFMPLKEGAGHPALIALSCHTNELGGDLSPELLSRVRAGHGDIPSLTELLPGEVKAHLALALKQGRVPVTALSLPPPSSSLVRRMRARLRSAAGAMLMRMRRRHVSAGVLDRTRAEPPVVAHNGPPADSLLSRELEGGSVYDDWFELAVPAGSMRVSDAAKGMEKVLEGFLGNQASTVSGLMAVRNLLVKPLGLRTSPLGCPASSLLSKEAGSPLFAGRFPVLATQSSADGSRVEVLLGANDKHLVFRSCVRVERQHDGTVRTSLGTRVRPINGFARVYMAVIERVHHHYIAPTMLRSAVAHALRASRRSRSAGAVDGAPCTSI